MSVSPRAATTLDPPPRPPRSPAAGSRATHRHSSSTLSSCRLLDCTPWARAAASWLRRLLLQLLPPAAARRPDKRAERGRPVRQPSEQGRPGAERDGGGGCREGRRAQSGLGSGADARHSAGVGLRAAGLRGGSDHCGCAEGGAQLRTGGGSGRGGRHRPGRGSAPYRLSPKAWRCAQADFGPGLRVRGAQPSRSPLGLTRTGCACTEPAHSAPAQTSPGLSRPLRQGSRRSPPPPPRRSSLSPPRAAETPRGPCLRSPPGLLPGYLVVGYSHVF